MAMLGRGAKNTLPPEATTIGFKTGNLLIDMEDFLLAYEPVFQDGFNRAIPRDTTATCSQHGTTHPAPLPACTCGLSAFYTIEQAVDYLAAIRQTQPRYHVVKNLVVFEALLSGPSIFSNEDFRAARQRITKVYLTGCQFCEGEVKAEFLSMDTIDTMPLHGYHYLYPTCETHAGGYAGKIHIEPFAERNFTPFLSLL